ncbi:jg9998 [Pararge aegeria aegeria]|uniref:Jg9998 protein n=2 Tax=Pararge aegeria TaxID=116150 RepID=A0A8S4SAC4_9NEOP|nr:jg9998 [Pararge aegeria aegeria]
MQLECLELAGCTLDRYINADNSRPSFLEITGISAQGSPTCSGINAGDYRNLAALLNHPNLSQLKIINKVPLPPEIMEHFAHMQCHCLMGAFPEISRVWLAIDSNIYVWAFEHGSDVAYFDGLSETIVSVGLVKPKSGVFQSFVKYLLVLTTTVEIVVLGVTFSSNKQDGSTEFEEIHLVPEPVFVLPTDGVSMLCVKSTSKGRIFMGGKDGCLYEITYQAQLGWFGKHCKKVNHSTSALSFLVPSFLNAALYDEDSIVKIEVDNTRHVLYTLSEKGCIEVFDLGSDGESLTKVVRLSQGKIVSSAVDIVKTLESSHFKPVIAISAVEETESDQLNLVAVTQTGARLYFSVGSGDVNQGGQRPQYLSLLHVRLPPGFTPNSSVLKPKQVHSAVYDNGTLVMVCSSGGGSEAESLWCLSRVLPGAGFSEAHTVLALDGPAWALTALPPTHAAHLSPALLAKREVWASSRWAVVSAWGAALMSAGAAPDLLRALLRDCRGPEAQPVKDMFQLHGVDQACACALYLACEDTSGDMSISEWAARAFLLYGNQPAPAPLFQQNSHSQMPSSVGSPKFLPRQVSTPMSVRPQDQLRHGQMNQSYQAHMNQSMGMQSQSFMPQTFQQNMSPTPFSQSSFMGNATQQTRDNFPIQAEYSAKHNGLYIYVGRILCPIWNLKCVTKSMTPDNKEFMSSKVTGEDCAYIVKKLQRVAAFVQRLMAPPHSEEQASLHALKLFITMAIEMLNLWKVLCEHQFHVIAASLPPEQQSALQAASFRELLVGGQEVASLLLGSLVAGYLRDNASVDGISQKLRQLCPTLYRQEDATCSKANELLIFAKQQKNTAEREEMLQQALKLCKDVAPNVNLPLVCSKLVSAGFYTGVVELCVACASKLDPQDKAVYYYKSDQPSQDREGHLMYYRRMEIYREVCVALERLYERSSDANTSTTQSDANHTLTSADSNYQGRQLVWDCLCRDDELLHVAVYEWLVSKNLGSELLSLSGAPPATLRTYLSAAARQAPAPASLHLLDLLWKVLEKAGDSLAAAHVLEGLATKPGTGATLAQRMSWVSAGVVCVRGAGARAAGGAELLRRLEEAVEVARVQAAVRAALRAAPVPPPHHLLQRLDDELLEITQLYEEYADRYNLWECKLAIVQCSGHNDALLVENIWSNILAEAEVAARVLPTPDERLGSVLSKLTTMGREYVNTGHCFPLCKFIFNSKVRQIYPRKTCEQTNDRSSTF